MGEGQGQKDEREERQRENAVRGEQGSGRAAAGRAESSRMRRLSQAAREVRQSQEGHMNHKLYRKRLLSGEYPICTLGQYSCDAPSAYTNLCEPRFPL